MKKAIALLLSIIFAFSLASCQLFSSDDKKEYSSSYTALIKEKNSSNGNNQPDESMLNTYISILTGDSLCDAVRSYLDVKYTKSEIKNSIQANIIDNSKIIQITATAETPENAYKIAKAHTSVALQYITMYSEGASMKIIDYPKLSK